MGEIRGGHDIWLRAISKWQSERVKTTGETTDGVLEFDP